MSTFKELWRKLRRSKRYREEFVASQLKRGIPFQIRTLMKQMALSQEALASRANLSQGVVSRAANPDYGNLTLNTIIRIAAGFDVAFIGRFVPFSELGRWFTYLSEDSVRAVSFEDEDAALAGLEASSGVALERIANWACFFHELTPVQATRFPQGKMDTILVTHHGAGAFPEYRRTMLDLARAVGPAGAMTSPLPVRQPPARANEPRLRVPGGQLGDQSMNALNTRRQGVA